MSDGAAAAEASSMITVATVGVYHKSVSDSSLAGVRLWEGNSRRGKHIL